MEPPEEQQFCLRWNNFQANITSQFETLRDDEDFTDVTIACEGQRLQAHKVVLSACSPYFKELFKTNPCSHPIIFMRDVEARHVIALMEFMYAGEVNVAQAHLSAFLKTAESLKIRGLTDTSADYSQREDDTLFLNPQPSLKLLPNTNQKIRKNLNVSCSSTVTSSQDIGNDKQASSPPPNKKQCKPEPDIDLPIQLDDTELQRLKQLEEVINVNPFALTDNQDLDLEVTKSLQPKVELPDYLSDEEREDGKTYFRSNNDISAITGGTEQNIIGKDLGADHALGPVRIRRRRTSDNWHPFDMQNQSGAASPDIITRLKECREKREKDGDRRNRLVKLGEGIEICEDQLRSVKWSDYRKLTRGLATILFSPAELATCSVTGQRWSRAGSGERPVKPALDRAKVQAIISYVATRFPMVEISRIKQVLAYKCKENSTAFKMKAVRYYGDQIRDPDKN